MHAHTHTSPALYIHQMIPHEKNTDNPHQTEKTKYFHPLFGKKIEKYEEGWRWRGSTPSLPRRSPNSPFCCGARCWRSPQAGAGIDSARRRRHLLRKVDEPHPCELPWCTRFPLRWFVELRGGISGGGWGWSFKATTPTALPFFILTKWFFFFFSQKWLLLLFLLPDAESWEKVGLQDSIPLLLSSCVLAWVARLGWGRRGSSQSDVIWESWRTLTRSETLCWPKRVSIEAKQINQDLLPFKTFFKDQICSPVQAGSYTFFP